MRQIGHIRLSVGRRGGFIESDRWRHRFVWHTWWMDNEPWRDESCPHCRQPFTEDPRFSCGSERMHMRCSFEPDHRHRWGTHADELDAA